METRKEGLMRTLACAVTVAVILAWGGLADAAPGDVRSYCTERHQSYDMKLYCVKKESAAHDRVSRRYYSFQSIDRDIYAYCVDRFDSWTMVEYCIGKEERAKKEFGR